MIQAGDGSGIGERRRRWLRYEFARLATYRNLIVTGIIAFGTCAVVYTAALALHPRPAVPQIPELDQQSPLTLPNPAHSGIQSIAPPAKVFNPSTTRITPATPRKQQKYYSASGEELVPSTPEILMKIADYYHTSSLPRGADLYEMLKASGFMMGNVVYVEQSRTWEHAVAIMPKGRLQHLYFFNYACGHRASTTPDPYRDLMYVHPQHVADRYAKLLCSDCSSMRKYKNAKKKTAAPKGGK